MLRAALTTRAPDDTAIDAEFEVLPAQAGPPAEAVGGGALVPTVPGAHDFKAEHLGRAREKLTPADVAQYVLGELRAAQVQGLPAQVDPSIEAELARSVKDSLIVDTGKGLSMLEVNEHGEYGYHHIYPTSVGIEALLRTFKRDCHGRLPETVGSVEDFRSIEGKILPASQILARHTTVAKGMVMDMRASRTFLNRVTGAFIKAPCPLRRLSPLQDQQIDEWLRALGGRNADKLLDWIATVTDLSRPTCALYVFGKASAGKSLLALGLDRLWRQDSKPTPLWRYFDTFNADVTASGLLVADEFVSQDKNNPITTEKIRDLITSGQHTINGKNIPHAIAKGCFRVMMLANRKDMLSQDSEDLGADAAEAVALRFLTVPAGPEPAAFLRALGGRDGATRLWVDGDLIARHALWLKETRVVKPGGRLLVEGALDESRTVIINSGPVADIIFGAVSDYLSGAKLDPAPEPGTFYAGKDTDGVRIFISTEKLRSYLQRLFKEGIIRNPVRRSVLGSTMSNWLRGAETTGGDNNRHLIRADGKEERLRVWDVDPEKVLRYAEANATDTAAMRARLEEPLSSNRALAGMGKK